MRAICINGSARDNGSTAHLVDQAIAGLRDGGVNEVSRYCLGKAHIAYCRGCKACYQPGGQCVQHDDMDTIMADLLAADIVLIASPSYWGDVTGQLKVFFDRSTPYCNTNPNHPPVPEGKVGLAIALRAGSSEGENQHIIASIAHYYGHLGITPAGSLSVTGVDCLDDLMKKPEAIEAAYALGRGVVR